MTQAEQELYDLARNWARTRSLKTDSMDDEYEESAWAEVLALVDRIADERVLAFARGALLAGEDAIVTAGNTYTLLSRGAQTHVASCEAVVAHIRNTVAQIEALEKAAADR